MENFKKCGIVLILFMAFIGCVGGIGYAIWIKAYFLSGFIAVLGVLAFPTFKKLFRLMND